MLLPPLNFYRWVPKRGRAFSSLLTIFRYWIWLLSVIAGSTVLAQPDTTGCDCPSNVRQTVAKVEANYAGYPARVSRVGEPKYRQFVDSLRRRAEGVQDPKECFYIISDYVSFFEDAHLDFRFVGDQAVNTRIVDITTEQVKDQLEKVPRSFIEGIWEKSDSSLTVAIVPDTAHRGQYQGIVIQSSREDTPEGLAYFTLRPATFGYEVTYYNVFSSFQSVGKQRDNLFQIGTSELWLRTYPYTPTEQERIAVREWETSDTGLHFAQLNDDFAYLKIPTFIRNDAQIAQLVADHDTLIRSTPHLIVDLRGNGGGQNGWVHLLPYLYTRPISLGYSYYRMSEDNTPEVRELLDGLANQPLSEEMRAFLGEEGIQIKKREFAELEQFTGDFFPVASVTLRYDSVTTYPETVAVIVDEQGGSSTEFFMNLCRQSGKTVTFGRHTFGMMDYQGASSLTPLPYPDYRLAIPNSKSGWTDTHPTNDTGFAPEVLIPTSVPPDEWVDLVMHYLRSR